MTGSERSPGLTTFAVLAAGALLIERRIGLLALTHLDGSVQPAAWAAAAVPVAALYVLLRPGSPLRLTGLALAFLVQLAAHLPRGANHEWFLAAVFATVLAASVWLLARRRSTPEALYQAVAPVVRWELVALYFWATLHKLNDDFFDPDRSCVTMQVYRLQDQLGMAVEVPDRLWVPLIVVTLVLEGALPVLLVAQRTRWTGVVLASAFHLVLGLNYPGFSAFLLAIFSLFVPQNALQVVLPVRPRHAGLRTPIRDALAVMALAAVVRIAWGAGPGLQLPWDHQLHYVAWTLLVVAAATIPLRVAWNRVSARALMRAPLPLLWALPTALWLHGAAPHLGLKNTQSLAMYSNLATEGGQSNHWLFPSRSEGTRPLDDLVRVHGSSDPMLALYARQSPGHNWNSTYVLQPDAFLTLYRPPRKRWTFLLPAHMVRARVREAAQAGATGIWMEITHDGRRQRLRDVETDPEWNQPTWVERTLLYSRGVPHEQRGLCMW